MRPAGDVAADLRALDRRLRQIVDESREQLAERAQDPFRGLYVSDADVDELLESLDSAATAPTSLAAPAGPISRRIASLSGLFHLDELERSMLLVCLAPEIDLRYERLYAYLQDDATRRRPTADLILRLLCATLDERLAGRAALAPTGRLLREGILRLADQTAGSGPLLGRPLRVDERVAEFLLGSDAVDSRIAEVAALVPATRSGAPASLEPGVYAGLVRLLQGDTPTSPLVYLHGPAGSGVRATARALCGAAGTALLLVDVPSLMNERDSTSVLELAAHEALFQGAILGLDGCDHLLQGDGDGLALRNALRRIVTARPAPTLLLGERRWEPSTWVHDVPSLRAEVTTDAASARTAHWARHFDGQLPREALATLAARYRLDDEAIQAVAAGARARAASRGEETPRLDDVQASARAVAAPPMEGLAQRIASRYDWDDIVLTEDGMAQLRELSARVKHQVVVLEQWGYGHKHARHGGATGLFAGPPGTGKTMAAGILAHEMGLDLYRIDLSAVVSKYIGETEKNLEKIFRAADQGDAILLFDEADAIFGKRSEVRDAHDRYANVETAYLLQRLENYEGLAILTTNFRGNIDEAFIRRLDAVIEFPVPEEAERLAIWQRALPPEAPVADDVDLPFLARKFKLAGGHIRNIALTAAYFAAAEGKTIGMRSLVRATRREYQKIGKLVAESDFEQYYALIRGE